MKLKNRNIILSKDKTKNYIKHQNYDFRLVPFNDFYSFGKGGNSFIFKIQDPNDNFEDRIIKICKSPLESNNYRDNKRRNRFYREIDALKLAKEKNFIIKYYFDSTINIENKTFIFYVMEKGETDLKEYILSTKLSIQEKVLFCIQIIKSLNELHSLQIYHRDIKPDNIFFISEKLWKIGDLGLISFRQEDESLDDPNEMIGPRGWISPEAMNKFLTYEINTEFKFDCKIDDKSDVFQLGKLFWFIFQCNVPIGQLTRDDFHIEDDDIFELLFWMLFHSKEKRHNLNEVNEKFKPLASKYVA